MDYIAFPTYELFTWLAIAGYVVLGLGMLSFVRVFFIELSKSAESKISAGSVASLVAVVSMLLLGASAVVTSTYLERGNRVAAYGEWYGDVTEGLRSYYGIEVTAKDLVALGYPSQEPEGRTYLGTTKLATGADMDEFAEVTLGINNGKVYLLEQDGATYTELEPATAR
jgi:hypothetical protein